MCPFKIMTPQCLQYWGGSRDSLVLAVPRIIDLYVTPQHLGVMTSRCWHHRGVAWSFFPSPNFKPLTLHF